MNRTAKGQPASPEPRLSSSDQIVRDIIKGLYEGRFVAGQRLVEPDLMVRYAVSRGTVREAIKRLAAEGVATQTTYRGAHIRQLTRSEARDILQLLEVNIGLAACLAAQNIDRSGMRETFADAFEKLTGYADMPDSFDFVRARNRFYRTMTLAGGNRELQRLMPGFQVHQIRTHLKQSQDERLADYRAIFDAIMKGDSNAAERAARSHLHRIAQALGSAPDTAFAPDATAVQRPIEDEDLNRA